MTNNRFLHRFPQLIQTFACGVAAMALTQAQAQYNYGDPASSPPDAKTSSNASLNPGYKVTDLAANLPHVALHTDDRLVNPWGIVISGDMLVVADNGTGLITSYGPGTGAAAHRAIVVPPSGTNATATPSGLALNPTGDFLIGTGPHKKAATLLVSTEDGTVAAWNSASGTNAIVVIDRSSSNAVYKSIAVAVASNGPALYAANFGAGTVDRFDTNFAYVRSFGDTNLTALGFAPFSIRRFQDKLVVAFAKQDAEHHDDVGGNGFGYIEVFTPEGLLVRNFTAQGALNSPWGLAIAPLRFGKFSQALLVGNFGDGWINAYNLFTGEYLGPLTDSAGAALAIQGLWGITFNSEPGPDNLEYTANTLYFTAGPNGEANGVLGLIKPIAPLYPVAH